MTEARYAFLRSTNDNDDFAYIVLWEIAKEIREGIESDLSPKNISRTASQDLFRISTYIAIMNHEKSYPQPQASEIAAGMKFYCDRSNFTD